MANAKRSLRADQRVLREKMHALGMSHRQVAVEFARRYRLRPRAAWRHAYGWSQSEAAEQISTYAAQSGLSPDESKVTMTGPHLCEYENWPGEASLPAGRRPTPYLLMLLAAVYGCTVHDLLDSADCEHMRPADRLIVGKPAAADEHQDHGQQPGAVIGIGTVPLATSPVGLAPLIPAVSRRRTASGVLAESVEDAEVLQRSEVAGPGDPPSNHHETDTGLPASDALDRLSERALILGAAHESSEHAELTEGSNVGQSTLEQLDADVRRIAADYVHIPPLPMFAEMVRVRNRIYRLLAGRQKPAATAQLYLLAGMLCGLLANVSTDLGHRDAAAEQARAAWAYGDVIGHNGLRAWTRGMQALIEYWSGRPQQAVRLAQSALPYADSAAAGVRLHSIEARAWALLGDAQEVSHCMDAAAEARSSLPGGDYLHDEVGGVFGFADTKSYCYAGAAFIHLGQAGPALKATSRAVELYAGGLAAQRSYGAESLARVDMATAHLLIRSLDGATESLAPVLAIPAALRIAQIGERLADVRGHLAGSVFSGAQEARDLRDRIDSFCSDTIVQEVDPPSPAS